MSFRSTSFGYILLMGILYLVGALIYVLRTRLYTVFLVHCDINLMFMSEHLETNKYHEAHFQNTNISGYYFCFTIISQITIAYI